MNNYNLYLLVNTCNYRSYIGITTNIKRRLRQHNGLIKGGAKYTRNFKGNGEWKYYLFISGYTKSECLSFERNVKNVKKRTKSDPIENRVHIINELYKKYPHGKIENCISLDTPL